MVSFLIMIINKDLLYLFWSLAFKKHIRRYLFGRQHLRSYPHTKGSSSRIFSAQMFKAAHCLIREQCSFHMIIPYISFCIPVTTSDQKINIFLRYFMNRQESDNICCNFFFATWLIGSSQSRQSGSGTFSL